MKSLLVSTFLAALVLAGCGGGGATPAAAPRAESATPPPPVSAIGQTGLQIGAVDATVPHHLRVHADIAATYRHPNGTSDAAAEATWQTVAKSVDIVETDNRITNVAHRAGIKVGFYSDVLRPHGNELSWYANFGGFGRDCSGNLVLAPYATPEYVGNPTDPLLKRNWYAELQAHLHDRYGSYSVDFVRSDDSGIAGRLSGGYRSTTGASVSSPYCNYSEGAWLAGVRDLYAGAPIPVLYNGATDVANLQQGSGPNVAGAECESCFNGWSGEIWREHADTEIAAVASRRWFDSYSHGPYTAQQRSYLYDSMLLGYDPAFVSLHVDQTGASSGIDTIPDAWLLPTKPLTTARSIDGYRSSEGDYVRRFAACYINRTFAGACAVVVNSDTVSHKAPASLLSGIGALTHTFETGGNGIALDLGDNGRADARGPRLPATIPAMSGYVAFP